MNLSFHDAIQDFNMFEMMMAMTGYNNLQEPLPGDRVTTSKPLIAQHVLYFVFWFAGSS